MPLNTSSAGVPALPGGRRPKTGSCKMQNGISHRTGFPSIFRLHDDILWRIFNLNTFDDTDFDDKFYTGHENSLITARQTSQVCPRWRTLMLSSSSLWANTIYLDHLNQKTDDWRSEVLKRTGISPLSVRGTLRVNDGIHFMEFFFSILTDHWTRLRRISIQVTGEGITGDARWLAMRGPAPDLKIIRISFPSCPTFSTAENMLFSNDNPSLHTLIIHCINFNLSGRWLSGVRHLELFGCSIGQKALHALAEMRSLEALDIMNVDIIDIGLGGDHSSMVILPRLSYLSLRVEFKTIITLLGHMVPTPGCTTKVESLNPIDPILSDPDSSLLLRGFTAHFQCFSNFWHNKTFSWTMTEEIFSLHDTLKDDSNFPQSSRFSLYLDIEGGSQWHRIPSIILTSLYSCDLGSFKILELDISHTARPALGPFSSDLTKFHEALTSVETLHLDSETIELFLNVQEHANEEILLPLLHTIVFDTADLESLLKNEEIIRFLILRRDAGRLIRTLKSYDHFEIKWNEGNRSEM